MTALALRTPEAMYATHGLVVGRTCGECVSCWSRLVPHATRGTVVRSVCRQTAPRVTAHGEATRVAWLKRTPACGLFRDRGEA